MDSVSFNVRPSTAPTLWVSGALVVASLALVGSLVLSLGMGLKACPLCFYQRTFMMGLVAVLAMGLKTSAESSRLSLLAMPIALGGLGVAAFHVFLEMSGRLECPMGLLGLGSAPQQSLAMFGVIFALLWLGSVSPLRCRVSPPRSEWVRS